jgi:hypothetical protein
MTGLYVFAVVGLWLWIAFQFSRRISVRVSSSRGLRMSVAALVFLVLVTAPVADELIGWRQFESLCRKYANQVIEPNAKNRQVVYVPRGNDQYASGTAVRIRIDPVVYKDAETNQVLVSYHSLHAQGGWLIRAMGISETNAPILFNSGCAPTNEDAFKSKLNITVIN